MIVRNTIDERAVPAATAAGVLGILPLVPLAIAAIGSGLAIGTWLMRQEDAEAAYKAELQPLKAPPTPPAPQTREQMTSWTVDELRRQWEALRIQEGREAIAHTPDTAPPKPADDTGLYVALALGAASLAVVMRS